MKSDRFFKRSEEVSDDFIQNVIFIDDEAFKKVEKPDNDLDPGLITKSFAKHQKICAVYNPLEESEISNLSFIAKKADVAVLDWRMKLKQEPVDPKDEEQDEAVIDPRGQHTITILKEILSTGKTGHDGLKLVIIYTGEIDLPAITSEIFNVLDNSIYKKDSDFKISSDYTTILIIGKPTLESQIKHSPELKDNIISYDDLPAFITRNFTQMTAGLVSNMALNAISVLRKNTSKILKIYNKNIDPAFLAHRSLLPTPGDAAELLKETILSSFASVLDYNEINKNCSDQRVNDWITRHAFKEKTLKIPKSQTLKINKKNLATWQSNGYIPFVRGELLLQFPNIPPNEANINSSYKNFNKAIEYFMPDDFSATNSNELFSMLTHHKSNYATASYQPRLTLGVVIRGVTTGKYWVCIQQKCDSVRIPTSESRKFLFLPLELTDGEKNFNFLTMYDGTFIRLKVDYNTHKIRTIKFTSNHNQMVFAKKTGRSTKFLFKPLYSKGHAKFDKKTDETFEWIFDLKDNHAQKVANHYSSQLSRVGLDESEWLRRNGGH